MGEFFNEQANGDWSEHDSPVRGKAAKLLLTDAQRTMIRNFNQSLPQLERVIVCTSGKRIGSSPSHLADRDSLAFRVPVCFQLACNDCSEVSGIHETSRNIPADTGMI